MRRKLFSRFIGGNVNQSYSVCAFYACLRVITSVLSRSYAIIKIGRASCDGVEMEKFVHCFHEGAS